MKVVLILIVLSLAVAAAQVYLWSTWRMTEEEWEQRQGFRR
jgi:hypothetical protein